MAAVTPEPRYFFIIGAMKAGTTSLYKYLAGHPELYASPRKEPRIFRDPGTTEDQRRAFLSLFDGRSHQPWCFEASTAYTKYPRICGVPQRLQAVVPDARFVYLVRNPVERAWSHYVHNLAQGREPRPFSEAIVERPQYLNISRYHLQLQQYLKVFPREQILVQVFEEMTRDPLATVRAVCDFLGVDGSYEPPTARVAYNASETKLRASRPLQMVRALGIEDAIPGKLRQWIKSQGSPLPTKKAGFPVELRAAVVDSLRADTEAFFTVFGRRIAGWPEFA